MSHANKNFSNKGLIKWAYVALAIVFGDIGTSPLYALKECFNQKSKHALALNELNILGVTSLVIWAILAVVVWKYIINVMALSNNGAGGILALQGLAEQDKTAQGEAKRTFPRWLQLLGLFGVALLFGDGVITPMISVTSAVEGLEYLKNGLVEAGLNQTAADKIDEILKKAVVPITLMVLLWLFSKQKGGTNAMARIFSPITLAWFLTIGVLGLISVYSNPTVLKAFNPVYAFRFFQNNGWMGFLILGSVVLAITGGEALYADMGHCNGRKPIATAWFGLVLPALLLNYLGQSAKLLQDKTAWNNPFYAIVPSHPVIYIPMVALATAATVVASQALISGAFALYSQGIKLGYLPRQLEVFTTEENGEQTYIGRLNILIGGLAMVGVVIYGNSTAMAGAYGIAVTGTMAITSILYGYVRRFHYSAGLLGTILLVVSFLCFDIPFFLANLMKVFEVENAVGVVFGKVNMGAMLPVGLGLLFFTVMVVWPYGQARKFAAIKAFRTRPYSWLMGLRSRLVEAGGYLNDEKGDLTLVKAKWIFLVSEDMTSSEWESRLVPVSIRKLIKLNHQIPEVLLLLNVQFDSKNAHIAEEDQVRLVRHVDGVHAMTIKVGFFDRINLPEKLDSEIKAGNLPFASSEEVIVWSGSEKLVCNGGATWKDKFFKILHDQATPFQEYVGLQRYGDEVEDMQTTIILGENPHVLVRESS